MRVQAKKHGAINRNDTWPAQRRGDSGWRGGGRGPGQEAAGDERGRGPPSHPGQNLLRPPAEPPESKNPSAAAVSAAAQRSNGSGYPPVLARVPAAAEAAAAGTGWRLLVWE